MKIFLILNIYFIIGLLTSYIIKLKFKTLNKLSLFDIFLYLILYLVSISILFAYLDFLNLFHLITSVFLLSFIGINKKYIHQVFNKKFIENYLILNFILIICLGQEFLWWDEFSSWGLKTKEILLHNSIFYENILTNLNKPIGSNLLHYFFIKYVGFKENIIIFSQFLVLILLLKNIFNDYKNRDESVLNFLLFLAIVYFISFILNYGVFSIYTGLISSLIFVKIFSLLFISSLNEKIKFIKLLPLVFLISFFKDFSLYYILYIFILLFIVFIFHKKSYPLVKYFFIIIVPFFFSLSLQKLISAKFNFQLSYSSIKFIDIFNVILNNKIDFNQILQINVFQGSIFRIFNKFFEIIFIKPDLLPEFKLNIIFWICIIFIINLLLFFSNKINFKKRIILLFSFFSLFFFHTYLILLSYNYFFGGAEANALASFGRYLGLFLMPYIIFLFLLANKEYDTKIYIKLVIILFCINLAPAKSIEILIPKSVFEINSHKSFILKNKENIINISNFIRKNYENKKHYVLIDNDDGYYHNFSKFIFIRTYKQRVLVI